MDKKRKILESALRLFVENGFHHTPTSKIAKEAGVAIGTMFYFFPTKEELIKALYVSIKGEITEAISLAIADELSLYGIFKTYYFVSLQWALEHKTEFRFVEQFNHSPYLSKIAEEEILKHINPVLSLLQQGVNDTTFKPLDIHMHFELMSSHTFGMNNYLSNRKLLPEEQDLAMNAGFELLWQMVSLADTK